LNPLVAPKEELARRECCKCPTKRKRKQRTVCKTGTYTETRKGTIKNPKRKIFCK